ncbi:CHAT domain-containing protein [Flammeovirga pectinis]|uniref:CHAT domain-containing protein n=1 Tax=Flammeovirga pectinis TaxID=2494373 RepID=A0A3Q9FM07_9BACT|nr:CHAT domain-containing protein [Flammeovirga pectinis]AZQ60856.1 CHAT domain-containing protein [Flammeovirga pectinis]
MKTKLLLLLLLITTSLYAQQKIYTSQDLRDALTAIQNEREAINDLHVALIRQNEKDCKEQLAKEVFKDFDQKSFFIKSATFQKLSYDYTKKDKNKYAAVIQAKWDYLEEVKLFLFHYEMDEKESFEELEELLEIIESYIAINTQKYPLSTDHLQKLADDFFYKTPYINRLNTLYDNANEQDKEKYFFFNRDVQRLWSISKSESLNFDKIISENLAKGPLDYSTVMLLSGKMFKTNQYYLATKIVNEAVNKIEATNDTATYFYQIFLMYLESLYLLQHNYEKVLEIQLKQQKLGFKINESMLISSYLKLKEYEKALVLCNQFLENNTIKNPFYSAISNTKIETLHALKRNNEAYITSIELIRKDKEKVYSRSYFTLSEICKEREDYSKAEKYILKAYTQSKKEIVDLPEMEEDTNITFSTFYLRFYKFYFYMKYVEILIQEKKFDNIDVAVVSEEYNYFDYLIKNIMLNPSKLDKQQIIKLSEECGDIIYLMAEKMPSPETLELAYNYTLLSKEIGLSSVIAIRKYAANSKNKEYKNLFEHWMQVRKQILFHNKNMDIDSLKDISFGLHKELAIKTRKEVFSKIEENDINWKNVDKALKDKEVAIEYVYYAPNNYAALVVTKGIETPQFVPLCKEDELKQLIEPDVRQSEKEINDIIYNQNSEKIAQLIITPLLPYLNDVKTIYYSPTGILHGLAFDALKVNIAESPQRFGKEFKLRRVSKTSQIANKTSFSKRKATIFGGMNYDDQAIDLTNGIDDERGLKIKTKKATNSTTSKNEQPQLVGGTFNYLNGTLKEVDLINEELTYSSVEVDLFTGTSATEDQFIEYCKTPTPILHIASHAYFSPYIEKDNIKEGSFKGAEMIYSDPDPMNRAGIVFSGANYFWETGESYNGKNDGILMASELSNYDLRDTKLAIISACQSGVGQSTRSEGVYGFQRAFKLAGIEHQIISLWTVDDAATQKFMTLFYKNFIELEDIDAAVNKAKDALQQEYNHPYYWAAFVHVQ